ncbi:NADH-ubiquinone oxidoreductase chain L (EC [Olavius algarvensis associated proteobacterium Delta 3]|nr:NADH-ubiquinone oxidoreductase chain L (EC [Olavius algarvensis associated proteobacterium Delta 3]CAB5128880.1 NADH-ubiquinone oxidoreductase chain L (EC [Olavius algarvensis associated proteobacterium Delta 3]
MLGTLNQQPILYAAVLASVVPLIAFLLIMVVTRRRPRVSAGLSIVAITIAFACSVLLLVRYWGLAALLQVTGTWVTTGQFTVSIGFILDPLSLLMVTVVSGISLLVQVYSLGYMAGDPGFSRYYAYMSLFAWAMISLVLSPNLLQLYVFWELVGVSSYLLIGFWYEKFSASEAGKKAFVMTRLGDVAFLLGLLTLLIPLGNLDVLMLNSPDIGSTMPAGMLTLSALLIFGGVVGKSAQFPLLTWLPDAMEGPTPVSALLHSATMVAAGVFLFARIFPFFSQSPAAMTVFLAIGTISMLLAATMAMVARDIKQVWAYSTISQLGFMIMGLAAGGYVAGVFHLITHAGFKALLFLCAGVFIHVYDSNDMFEIGRQGGRRLKIPMACMIVGAAALSGLPPLSGFFSKEAIIGVLATQDNRLWLGAALVGVVLTAYYTFRLIFIMLFPSAGAPSPPPTSGHGHHGRDYWTMATPLLILAAVTLVLGFAQTPLTQFLLFGVDAGGDHGHGERGLLIAAIAGAVGGVLLAWFEFGRKGSPQIGFVERIPALATLFSERWYLDRIYRWLLDRVVYGVFSRLATWNDERIINDGVDAFSDRLVGSGRILATLHRGMIQYKLLVMFSVVALLGLYFFF